MSKARLSFFGLLFLVCPLVEAGAWSAIPGTAWFAPLFVVIVVVVFSTVEPAAAAATALAAAAWRDLVLVTPYAPTLFGTFGLTLALGALPFVLTNRSLFVDGVRHVVGYGLYVLGVAGAAALAYRVGLTNVVPGFSAAQFATGAIVVVLVAAVTRRSSGPRPSVPLRQ